MSQLKRHSAAEAIMNTGSGMVISILAGLVVYPMFGYDVPLHKVTGITIIFTILSVARSYIWRRVYNWLEHGGGFSLLRGKLTW